MTRPPRGTAQLGQMNMYRCKSAPLAAQHRQQTTAGTGKCLLDQRSAGTGMGTDQIWERGNGGDAAGSIDPTWAQQGPGPEVLWDRESLGRGSFGSRSGEKSTWMKQLCKHHTLNPFLTVNPLDNFFSFLTFLTRAFQHTHNRQGRRSWAKDEVKLGV